MKQLIVMVELPDDHPWVVNPPPPGLILVSSEEGQSLALTAKLEINNRRNLLYTDNGAMYVTPSGLVLANEAIQDLADEAEQGTEP